MQAKRANALPRVAADFSRSVNTADDKRSLCSRQRKLPGERMTGRTAPCIVCGEHVSRQQKSWKCAGCSSLGHKQCTKPVAIRGLGYLSCCAQPSSTTATTLIAIPSLRDTIAQGADSTASRPCAVDSISTVDTAISAAASVASLSNARTVKRKPSPSRSPSSQAIKLPCTAVTPAPLAMEGDDGEEAPAYFKKFVTEFRSEVADIKRVAEETRDECRNELQQTKAQTQKNARDISGLKEHARLRDKCEVSVLGLPSEWSSSYAEAAAKLAAALDLHPSILDKAYYRAWEPRNQDRSGSSPTKGFVIEFDTPKNRDKFVSVSPKLKYLSARHVFGLGSFGTVSIRAIWPSSVFRLMSKAVKVSKEQSWLRPVVDNLVVCIRIDRSKPSVPIFSEDDLQALVAEHGSRTSSQFSGANGASSFDQRSNVSGLVTAAQTNALDQAFGSGLETSQSPMDTSHGAAALALNVQRSVNSVTGGAADPLHSKSA